ncbi:diacylglycerol kinase [Virgisporangium aliadipatigenens]|uniref:Diacylglycerol kinase n=1 Tax=Virgisporangium aliadipatigenens TaxID=741659 RepID=A0A8J4DUB8_9ACTN|nr:diacylglycerol kinase family protein [Virgisporangium aliadipatigenens]GIJ50171.1 diacylglycerol kinase [Virgisporangium aliadipatigenens]
MRALLVVNPKATTTSERSRDILVRALRSEVDLTVEYTKRRGHAATLARDAARAGIDVVVTLGGDGTVNEAVNGLLTAEPGAKDPAGGADRRPALAVVPGGSTNVFARAIGLPRDWAEGTYVILQALRAGTTRTIGLGRADDRYFTFCAGYGLDAEVIRRVERARLRGKVSTPWLYMRSIGVQYFTETERKTQLLTLERSGEADVPSLASVVVQNTAPWTYVGDRAVNACPDASFDKNLDVMALKVLRVPSTARFFAQLASARPALTGKQVLTLHDVGSFTLRASRPLSFQLDGDYLGERGKVEFVAVPQALRVVC